MLSRECIDVPGVAEEVAIVRHPAMPQLIVCVEAPGIHRPRGRCNHAVMSPAGYLSTTSTSVSNGNMFLSMKTILIQIGPQGLS